jgi:hypothetical protein
MTTVRQVIRYGQLTRSRVTRLRRILFVPIELDMCSTLYRTRNPFRFHCSTRFPSSCFAVLFFKSFRTLTSTSFLFRTPKHRTAITSNQAAAKHTKYTYLIKGLTNNERFAFHLLTSEDSRDTYPRYGKRQRRRSLVRAVVQSTTWSSRYSF